MSAESSREMARRHAEKVLRDSMWDKPVVIDVLLSLAGHVIPDKAGLLNQMVEVIENDEVEA